MKYLILTLLVSLFGLSCKNDNQTTTLCGDNDKYWHSAETFFILSNGDTSDHRFTWWMSKKTPINDGQIISFKKDGTLKCKIRSKESQLNKETLGRWKFEEEGKYLRYHVIEKWFDTVNPSLQFTVEKLTEDELLIFKSGANGSKAYRLFRTGKSDID
jgi:hypothetical protein